MAGGRGLVFLFLRTVVNINSYIPSRDIKTCWENSHQRIKLIVKECNLLLSINLSSKLTERQTEIVQDRNCAKPQ